MISGQTALCQTMLWMSYQNNAKIFDLSCGSRN